MPTISKQQIRVLPIALIVDEALDDETAMRFEKFTGRRTAADIDNLVSQREELLKERKLHRKQVA